MRSNNQFLICSLLFSFLLNAISVSAQKIGDNNAEWVYDFNQGGSGITKIKAVKDTLVGSQNLRLFRKDFFLMVNDELIFFPREPFFIREINNIVEYSGNLVVFDTIYNFNATIGESWSTPLRELDNQKTGFFISNTVLDTFTILINNQEIFAQEVLAESSLGVARVDTFFQNIGSRLNFFPPFDFPPVGLAIDGDERGPLRCYNDNVLGTIDYIPFHLSIGTSLSDVNYDCNDIVSLISTQDNRTNISIFPNPSKETVTISLTNENIESVEIYSMTGSLVKVEKANSKELNMGLEGVRAGVYFILVNKRYYSKLSVIQ